MLKKKSLGQNFLNNPHYLRLIADAAEIKTGESVLEVGPGEGVLTRELLARGARVVAVEKDRRLIPLLENKFSKEIAAGQLTLVEADALEFDAEKVLPKAYKLVANIPYYITGALLKKFLSSEAQPSRCVLLLQKEVVERIARYGPKNKAAAKESILSLSVKAYGAPKFLAKVPRGAFTPAPKVDSAILVIAHVSKKNFSSAAQEERFFALVKKGFSSKRKLLLNNLGKEYSNILQNVGVSETARAEDLTLEQWLKLAKN